VWSVLYPDGEVQIGNGEGAGEDADRDVPAA
jgi:hypothetical protein